MPNPGNSGLAQVFYYTGSPVGVNAAIFDAPAGSIIINLGSPWYAYIKTSPLGDNSGYAQLTPGLSSTTQGIGYGTGAGGAVSQLTNRSTGVTLNTLTGQITGQATSLAAGASATFTVTNSLVGLNDIPVIAVQSGPTAGTSVFSVATVAAGSFAIKAWNLNGATADTGAPIINFAIIKGALS